LRKHIRGAKVGKIFLDEKDRILLIPYYKQGTENYFAIFWRGRSAYFLNLEGENSLFKSWSGIEKIDKILDTKSILDIFNPLGRGELELKGKDKKDVSIKDYFASQSESLSKGHFPKRKRKNLERKEHKIINDLGRVRSGPKIREALEASDFEIGDKTEIVIAGVKFKFSRKLNEYQKRNQVYQKIKGFKIGEAILEKRLGELEIEKRKWLEGNIAPKLETKKIIMPVWAQQSTKTKISSPVALDYFKTDTGLKIAIGKDVNANDYLRNKWASKEDFWFHLEGLKSPHLIIKCSDTSLIPFPEIGSIIRDYGKYDITEIPLVYTQVKNLKGLKGKSGSVTFKKAKYIRVEYQQNWPEKIIRL
jgi:predicted ribosome quality control (RQC) complex YloA/Tae2 family protein